MTFKRCLQAVNRESQSINSQKFTNSLTNIFLFLNALIPTLEERFVRRIMKAKMNRNQAQIELYELWQKRRLPEDFTNEHADYEMALKLLEQRGKMAIPDLLEKYKVGVKH